jgi:hypothetical protein
MKIEIKYNGKWPNLCSGNLSVIINKVRYDFPDYCLHSGGQAWTNDDYTGGTTGEWSVREWPENFPEEFKEATLDAINEQITHGCCGGCI